MAELSFPKSQCLSVPCKAMLVPQHALDTCCVIIDSFSLCVETIKVYNVKFARLLVQFSVYFSSRVNLGKYVA